MTNFRISEVAELIGVSGDTVRRWIDSGRLAAKRDEQGWRIVAGTDLAEFMRSGTGHNPGLNLSSARNRFRGLVTDVTRDGVMAQVELQVGSQRVVSLMSREAADDLGLEVGRVATALVKSTNVIVEAAGSSGSPHA
ncbi:TOBE domain-containing protein [Salinactinospora qingdaonensis]|uniref:TOBE domain-containing protein n=1 Tax=Salinactinospora qingdaonensis TaxID=702744 RepID=A0ABP7G4P6_9ACTN